MIDRIIKPTSKQTVDAILSGDFSVVDKIKAAAKKDARQVFNAVSSGAVSLIWYDLPPVRCQSGAVSVMRYALHRSPQKADHLQLSCMGIKDGRIIPTSADNIIFLTAPGSWNSSGTCQELQILII